MAKSRGRTERRHVREKATIDYRVQDVYEPKAPDQEHTVHSPRPLPAYRSRIRFARNGNPRKGSLPTFCR
jgi:hypothetical protein